MVGEEKLSLVLVDRLSSLLSRTLWALGQLASVKLCKVTSKSASLQLLLLLLLALEQLLLIEVTLLQLRGETFPDDVLQKVRLPKLRLSSLSSLQKVGLPNILL